jgi:hypothetical protein
MDKEKLEKEYSEVKVERLAKEYSNRQLGGYYEFIFITDEPAIIATLGEISDSAYIEGYKKAESSYKEIIHKLEYMIEHGLGAEDLKNDITYPNGE